MLPNSFAISGFLSAVAHRGRSIIGLPDSDRHSVSASKIIDLCHKLISSKGEASGIALAFEILNCYQYLTSDEKLDFFKSLQFQFSASQEQALQAAQDFLNDPTSKNLSTLSAITEPLRRQLILRLNQAPNATLALIKMREDLLGFVRKDASLATVDDDFKKLFTSWFNGGFLILKRLDWESSASILEKIIRYEAVHNMSGWDDLRKRLDPSDRHIYGFFHPRLKDEPLIFVEVALTAEKPSDIDFILKDDRQELDPSLAKTATFYSISNCQNGLRGVPLGSFLIKQVVEELRKTFSNLEQFVTLSPVPGFAKWLKDLLAQDDIHLSERQLNALTALMDGEWQQSDEMIADISPSVREAVAYYLTRQKTNFGLPKDAVARFHLGNGAQLERINWPADYSQSGMGASFGAMVNYRYKLADIEKNHERFVESGEIATAAPVTRQARTFDNNMTLVQTDAIDVA